MAKILYVEDNESNILLVRKILESAGHDVIIARTGYEGLKLAKETHPDMIIMDINLPDIDGYTITSIVKANEAMKKIPIVALTANVIEGERERSIVAGCDGYIKKPIEVNSFLTQINEYLLGKKEKIEDIELREILLKQYTDRLAQKMEHHLERLHEFSKTEAELELTKSLQRLLLPKEVPFVYKYDIAYTYIPAKFLAGDYIDIIKINTEFLFLLFDVAGHGISAAMVMTIIRSLIHSQIEKLVDPFYIINFVNNALTTELMSQKYVVGSILYLNNQTDVCSYFRFGGMPLLIYRRKQNEFEHIHPNGIFLGAFETSMVFKQLSSEQFYCETGDIVLLYSDGLVDLHFKEGGEFFGEERVKSVILRNKDKSAQKIADEIKKEVAEFCSGRERTDDISFIIIKKTS